MEIFYKIFRALVIVYGKPEAEKILEKLLQMVK